MNPHERAIELEDLLNHYFRNGEASIGQAALDLKMSPTVLMRVARRMESRGELVSRHVTTHQGRKEARWCVVMTRKAA